MVLLLISLGKVWAFTTETTIPGSTCETALRICGPTTFTRSVCSTYRGQKTDQMEFWFYFTNCTCTDPDGNFETYILADNANALVEMEYTDVLSPGSTLCGQPLNSHPFSPYSNAQQNEFGYIGSFYNIWCFEGVRLFHITVNNACNVEIDLINFKFINPCCEEGLCCGINIPPPPCEECIADYGMEPNETYLISTWVSELPQTSFDTNFDNPQITITFLPGNTTETLSPSNQYLIIDGWQKMEKEILVPSGTTGMTISFECLAGDCFFDDIRIHPKNGSMKTYVYDSYSLRLVAQLDERNYATFYEYDEEGRLIRTKKETERGIMTIQENILSTVKNPE